MLWYYTCHVFAGTGKEVGDRHPKVNDNVLIGANATILGNITIGKSGTMFVLFDIHKVKLNRYTRDVLNKPIWRELTCVACT